MDERFRGYIESEIDRMVQEEIVEDVEWVQEEIPVSSLRDLALGYMIGLLRGVVVMVAAARTEVEYNEAEKTARAIIKRRLPEIIEKIERELHR